MTLSSRLLTLRFNFFVYFNETQCLRVLDGAVGLILVGCSKSDNTVTPASTKADLLVRTWEFDNISVKTDAKTYTIPVKNSANGGLLGDDNTVNFNKDNTFSYVDSGKKATGKWTLTNEQTLTLTDADNVTTTWTVNAIDNTNLELASSIVNVTKGNDLTDIKVYSYQEQSVAVPAFLLLASTDKAYGGTIDFSKEPDPKSVQLLLVGKAQ